jgi:hypothetical protein
MIVLHKEPALVALGDGLGDEGSMKALLSTTLLLTAVTLAGGALAAVTLVAVILATAPGFAADAAFPPSSVVPAEFQRGVAPNRLDVYDMRRELAREAEHQRIRTRLGDPGRWCQPVAGGRQDDFGMAYPGSPGMLVIVCR